MLKHAQYCPVTKRELSLSCQEPELTNNIFLNPGIKGLQLENLDYSEMSSLLKNLKYLISESLSVCPPVLAL